MVVHSLVQPLEFAGLILHITPCPDFEKSIDLLVDRLRPDFACVQFIEERGEDIGIDIYMSSLVNTLDCYFLGLKKFFKTVYSIISNRMYNPIDIHSGFADNSDLVTIFSFDQKKADTVDTNASTPFPRNHPSDQPNCPPLPIAFIFRGSVYQGGNRIGPASQESLDNLFGMECSMVNANSIVSIRLRSIVQSDYYC